MLTHGKIMNFLTPTQTKKHPTTVCASQKEFEKFSLGSREFSGKTVESKVTKQNRSRNYLIFL